MAQESLVDAAAWRLAAEVARRVPGGAVIEESGPARVLLVRSGCRPAAEGGQSLGGSPVVSIAREGRREVRTHGAAGTIFDHEAWGNLAGRAEVVRLASLIVGMTIGKPAPSHALPTTANTLVARLIALCAAQHALTDEVVRVLDMRGAGGPAWLSRRDDLFLEPGMESDRPVWGIVVDGAVVGAMYEGWLPTPAGETINLFARYRAGDDLSGLLGLALTPGLVVARPPGVVDLPPVPFDRTTWLPTIYSYEMYWRTAALDTDLVHAIGELVHNARQGDLPSSVGVDTLRAMLFYIERAAHQFGEWRDPDHRAAALIAERLHATTTGRVRRLAHSFDRS